LSFEERKADNVFIQAVVYSLLFGETGNMKEMED
jgi:hypothetical protein